MQIEEITSVALTPDEVVELMLSATHLERLVARLDMVDQIEELSRVERDGQIERVLRYRAPTAGKIPSFLSRYKDRAPEHVYWEQREVWVPSAHGMAYRIVPEVPEGWHKRYTNSGALRIVAHGAGSRVITSLSYEIKVMMLGGTIERALEPEIKRLLKLQGEAILDGVSAPGSSAAGARAQSR